MPGHCLSLNSCALLVSTMLLPTGSTASPGPLLTHAFPVAQGRHLRTVGSRGNGTGWWLLVARRQSRPCGAPPIWRSNTVAQGSRHGTTKSTKAACSHPLHWHDPPTLRHLLAAMSSSSAARAPMQPYTSLMLVRCLPEHAVQSVSTCVCWKTGRR